MSLQKFGHTSIYRELDYNLLLYLCLFFISGLLLYSPLLIFIALLFCLLFPFAPARGKIHILLCILSLGLGVVSIHNGTKLPSNPEHIVHHIHDKTERIVFGKLAQMPIYNGTTTRLLVETEYFSTPNTPTTATPVTGLVSLSIKGPLEHRLFPGDMLAIRAHFKRPQGYLGNGIFYYPKFLAQKNIWVTGYIPSPLYIQSIQTDEETTKFLQKIQYSLESFRYSYALFLSKIDNRNGPIFRALLLGDKSLVPETVLEDFKRTGLMHILAISGLHIAVLASTVFFVILSLLKTSTTLLLRTNVYKVSMIFTFPIIALYVGLTGMQAPVLRSLLMFTFLAIALWINRVKSFLPALATSAVILLLYNPTKLYTASFLLSYTAVTAIVLSLPFAMRKLYTEGLEPLFLSNKFLRIILLMLWVSFIASLATIPISLYFFNRISVLGPITNLLVEPLICLIALPIGFLSLCIFHFSEPLAATLLQIGSYPIDLALYISHRLAELSYGHFWLPTPHVLHCIIFYGLLLLTLVKKRYVIQRPAIVVCIILSLLLFFISPNEITKRWFGTNALTLIDVGQGSANLIEFKGGERILIDGGGNWFSRGSIGERVITPFLWKKGIQTIDAIYISHGDADHYNGLLFVIHHFRVGRIVIPSGEYYGSGFLEFLEEIKDQNIQIMQKGEEHQYGESRIYCVENFALNNEGSVMRNKGLVLQLITPETKVLFTGDIHEEQEKIIIDQEIQSPILISPHHGSKTSSSRRFLEKISPDIILISSGYKSIFFPAAEVVARMKSMGIPFYTTANHGSLELTLKKDYVLQGVQSRNFNPLRQNPREILFEKNQYKSQDSSANSM